MTCLIRVLTSLFLLSASMLVGAETQVTGPIVADTLWQAASGPYVVDADLAIRNGAALTVGPGTEIQLGHGVNLRVEAGRILAQGTAAHPVRITSRAAGTGGAARRGIGAFLSSAPATPAASWNICASNTARAWWSRVRRRS